MKPVFHGRSILKAALVVATTGIALGLVGAALGISSALTGLIGMAGGVLATVWSMAHWDMWHFE